MVCDGASSAPITVASGVPQCTVLGPILFLFYVNNLADGLKSTVRRFADGALYCFLESDKIQISFRVICVNSRSGKNVGKWNSICLNAR